MPSPASESHPQSPAPRWSNRILIASLAGILFLTLYPFRLVSHARLSGSASPFLLGGLGKDISPLDDFLNVLLFVPLGFGLAEKLRERGKRRAVILAVCLLSGAVLSYGIEFAQNYIPLRDSGWEDIFTNTTGAVVGFLLFELCRQWVLELLSIVEATLDMLLTWRHAAAILVIYFACWFAFSAHLQKFTRLRNWDPNCLLVVGNDAMSRPLTGWEGAISSLQLWDRALPDSLAAALTAGKAPDTPPPGLLAAYDFSGSAPFRDRISFLPSLAWKPSAPTQADLNEPLDGSAWLSSAVPVSNLVSAIQRSNQFAIRVVGTPALDEGANATLVSISNPSGLVDLAIRQDDANLVFWFRNPLSVRHATLAWPTPNILEAGKPHDILYSYDGANLSLFIDGRKDSRSYHLGPAAVLVRRVHTVKTPELDGYTDIYYAFIFFPAGILLGVATRNLATRDAAGWIFLIAALFAPPWIFERVLASVSGRPFSLGYAALSLMLLAGGAIWMNLDDPPQPVPAPL
jgi:glycopeptide antibiotics resistance protein